MGEKKKTLKRGHQALYRKYRSKSLNEVVGQEHITKTLANAIEQGKISHAYLFTGPRGTGKTSVARIIAHEINKLPYTNDTPHLDIIEIDAASNRRIDDIRDLRDKVNITPVSAKYKVYIIDEVHMLTPESFNALLKTLEEPPEHVIFILATTEVHKLPATIISRTQRHTFKLIPEEKIIAHLKNIAKAEAIDIEEPALQLLVSYGGGSFRDSISLLDQLASGGQKITSQLIELFLGIAPKVVLEQLMINVEEGQAKAVLEKIEQLLENGLTPNGISQQLLNILREQVRSTNLPKHIELMKQLLEVGSSQYPLLKLETSLLEATVINTDQPTQHDIQKKTKTPVKNQLPSTQSQPHSETQPPKISSAKVSASPTITKKPSSKKQQPILEEQWQEILKIVKKQNNPLYTILRLAEAIGDDKQLTLTFGFVFHQKRVDTVKNKSIISQAVESLTGHAPEIITALNKSLQPNPQTLDSSLTDTNTSADNASASLMTQIKDIMGGGEIVNV